MSNKTKKIASVVEVLEDIICDMCGLSCIVHEYDNGIRDIESAHFYANWGYGSRDDGENWAVDLCIDCAYKVKNFIENNGGKVIVSEGGL
mgnify:CR=1 FL=1